MCLHRIQGLLVDGVTPLRLPVGGRAVETRRRFIGKAQPLRARSAMRLFLVHVTNGCTGQIFRPFSLVRRALHKTPGVVIIPPAPSV